MKLGCWPAYRTVSAAAMESRSWPHPVTSLITRETGVVIKDNNLASVLKLTAAAMFSRAFDDGLADNSEQLREENARLKSELAALRKQLIAASDGASSLTSRAGGISAVSTAVPVLQGLKEYPAFHVTYQVSKAIG